MVISLRMIHLLILFQYSWSTLDCPRVLNLNDIVNDLWLLWLYRSILSTAGGCKSSKRFSIRIGCTLTSTCPRSRALDQSRDHLLSFQIRILACSSETSQRSTLCKYQEAPSRRQSRQAPLLWPQQRWEVSRATPQTPSRPQKQAKFSWSASFPSRLRTHSARTSTQAPATRIQAPEVSPKPKSAHTWL